MARLGSRKGKSFLEIRQENKRTIKMNRDEGLHEERQVMKPSDAFLLLPVFMLVEVVVVLPGAV